MKYIKKIIFFAVILISLGLSNVYAASGIVTEDGIRVRKGPSTDTDIINTLNKNATLEIIEKTGDWYKIKYTATANFEGYMHSDFIKKTDDEEIPDVTPSSEPTTVPTQEPTAGTSTPEPTQTPLQEEPKTNLLGDKVLSSDASVYILPVITSSIKDTAKKNTEVYVQEVAGNFAYVKFNNKFGWVKTNLLQDKGTVASYKERKAYVNITQAIVRREATTASDMITSLTLNDEVTIIGEEADFYKVRVSGGDYYMAKWLLSDTKQQTTNRGSSTSRQEAQVTPQTQTVPKVDNTQTTVTAPTTTTETSTVTTSSVGAQIAQMAKSYVGYKYVYGGAKPSTGFDCSGLVYYICGQLGYSVNRTADAQANNGVYVAKSDLQPGDLLFFTNFNTGKGIGHVGIYIGNNQFVHASTPTTGVITSTLSDSTYVNRYVTARRIY